MSGVPTTRRQLEVLTANLRQVHSGKAYGIDEQGALIGKALKSSFKGKVVDLLVNKGLARQGNLGGRIATSLVGKASFDMILQAHADPQHKSSVANAVALIKKYENEEAVRTGVDFDTTKAIRSMVQNNVSIGTSLRALAGGRITNLHDAIWNDIVPKRQAARTQVLDNIANGQPTPGMAKANQFILEGAALAISDGRTGPDEKFVSRDTAGSGQTRTLNQTLAEDIVAEYNTGVGQIRASAENEADADTRVAEFKQQFLDVMRAHYEAMDVEDGMRTDIGGEVTWGVKPDYTDAELGGRTPFRTEAHVRDQQRGAELNTKKSVLFASDEKTREFADDVGELKATPDYVFENVEEMIADTDPAGVGEIAENVKDLSRVLLSDGAGKEDKLHAAELLGNPVFHDSFENVRRAIRYVGHVSEKAPEIAGSFMDVADAGQLRSVINKELDLMRDILLNPEKHRQEGGILADYQEAFRDPVRGLGPSMEVDDLIQTTREQAQDALATLDKIIQRASVEPVRV